MKLDFKWSWLPFSTTSVYVANNYWEAQCFHTGPGVRITVSISNGPDFEPTRGHNNINKIRLATDTSHNIITLL